MRTYVIHRDQITVASSSKSGPDGAIVIRSTKDLDAARFPVSRLVGLWNALPGAEAVKRFPNRALAVKRLWEALQRMPAAPMRADSKQAKIIALLRRSQGASIDELTKATGWQRHTVRGVLSGAIKKKLGMPLTATKDDAGTTYRIAS